MVRPSWKLNLKNAFPIPDDHLPPNHNLFNYDGDFTRTGTFSFLLLPPEIRNRIYFLCWYGTSTLDKYHKPHPPLSATDRGRLNLALTSKRLHAESTHLLYTTTTFRLFPLQDFLFLPTPLSLPPHYRSHITTLSLIVGSSWTNPPANWRVGKALTRCLGRMRSVRQLTIFIELDPSVPMFAKYRRSETFYTEWCGALVSDVLKALVESCAVVEVDGNPGVDPHGPLAKRVVQEVEASGRKAKWGVDWMAKVKAIEENRVVPLATGVVLDEVHALADGLRQVEIKA